VDSASKKKIAEKKRAELGAHEEEEEIEDAEVVASERDEAVKDA
jgi:hypothetical protein